MKELLESLRSPDVSSSLLPLLVVTAILVVAFTAAFLAAAIKIARLIRTSRRGRDLGSEGKDEPGEENDTARSHRRSFRRFFGKPADAGDAPPPVIETEIEQLRKHVERLQRESLSLRDQYAKAIGRISELEGVLRAAEAERMEGQKLLELEIQRRRRVESKGERLEMQLQEIIAEVEKIYQQNAQISDIQNISGRLGEILKSASDEKAPVASVDARLAEKDAEIQQLKSLLAACRKQILEMAETRVKQEGQARAKKPA